MVTRQPLWYFDAYNVLHAVLLGRDRDVPWWHRDYQERVIAWVATLSKQPPVADGSITVVFDCERVVPELEQVNAPQLTVIYTPSADDWIVEACAREVGVSVHVVSADRALGDRARLHGARVIRPWELEGLGPAG